MKYSSPELVVIGRAEVVVLGQDGGMGDNGSSTISHLPAGIAVGLDD